MNEAWAQKKGHISAYYSKLIEEHGHDPRACDYGRSASQQKKFEVLADVMPLDNKRILDVGCGFADFAGYLNNRYKHVTYEGVDIAPRMIEEARQLHPKLSLRTLDIIEEDPGGPYDLVTANGIFYLLGENAESLVQKLIKRMFDLCSEAVAFNSLSSWTDQKEENEFYADPLAVVDFCKTLSPWVVLRHDYFPHDFSIYLYRKQRA